MIESRRRIYLDYNATQPLTAEARAALVDALDLLGNPSSVHGEGRRARAVVEAARSAVAALVGGQPENVVFTSGATEAAVTCLTPHWVRDGAEIEVAALGVLEADHPATREGGRFPPDRVTRLPVDAEGLLDMPALASWLDSLGGRTGMLALGLANGETGVIQRIEAIRAAIGGRDIVLVLDAAQAAGRIALDLDSLGVDALCLSGHKLGAAKGVGALVLGTERLRPFRLLPGGGQERGLRSGTEAVPAIASFGAAARAAASQVGRHDARMAVMRERVAARLRAAACEFIVLGEDAPLRLANTLALSFAGAKAETVQIALDLAGFAVSAGSACSSGKVGANHALAAMAAGGLAVDPSLGLVRISFGAATAETDAEALADTLAGIVRRMQDVPRERRAA